MPITPDMTFDQFVTAQGLIFRAEIGFSGVPAAGVVYTGVTTGSDEVVILQRAYSSSESILLVELFEASWSAGTPARVLNRRFSSAQAAPGTVMQGITPGTLGSAITGVTLRATTSTGSAALAVSSDDSRLFLKASTSYVVRYTNQGAGIATIGNSFDFRKVLKGNWDGVLASA